jgi:hypothetical protein
MRGRRDFIVGVGLWAAAGAAHAQSLTDLINGVLNKNKPGAASATAIGATLSQGDAAAGLKEALNLGVIAATTRLGKADGFFGDGKVHIPLPATLARAQKSMKPLGLSGPLDDVELKMNRAAEASMPAAKTMFVNAVKSITLTDALSILRGGDTAATGYLRERTTPSLTGLLRPMMETTLQTTGAFTALDRASAKLGGLATLAGGANAGANLKVQVIDFAVAKALDGAFFYVGEEERAIRKDPVKRTTGILKKVFGTA